MMQQVYRDRLQEYASKGDSGGANAITLKYKDEDGDLITMFDSSDLATAIQYSRVLKLSVFINGKPVPSAMSPHVCYTLDVTNAKTVRQELRIIRDRLSNLLDSLNEAASTNGAAGS